MKDRKLASRYAGALLSVFSDPQQAEATDEFLSALRDAMEQQGEFRDVMLDPAYSRDVRKGVLRSLAEQQQLPETVGRFLDLLVENNRLGALATIAEVFHETREEALGIVPAEITTATPLEGPLQDRTRATLERLTGRKVRLNCKVEPDLLGGAVTRIGSKIYDGSLRSHLNELRRKMAQE